MSWLGAPQCNCFGGARSEMEKDTSARLLSLSASQYLEFSPNNANDQGIRAIEEDYQSALHDGWPLACR